jgi:nucleotide-binding universal stress UspA family protein
MQMSAAALKPAAEDGSKGRARAVSPGMTILVATDGSRGGDAALRFAARFACGGRARLVVLTIGSCGQDLPPEPSPPVWKRHTEEQQRRAERALQSASRRAQASPPPVQYRFLLTRRPGQIPETIAREADRLGADLVVVGSEGRDTLEEWVVGGVALRLIYVARRPVAVVRPPKMRKPAALTPS